MRFKMNKVYSLKYSARTKGLVAVSEHAKRTSKKGMKKKTILLTLIIGGYLYISPHTAYCSTVSAELSEILQKIRGNSLRGVSI